jgi:hypothetical protein
MKKGGPSPGCQIRLASPPNAFGYFTFPYARSARIAVQVTGERGPAHQGWVARNRISDSRHKLDAQCAKPSGRKAMEIEGVMTRPDRGRKVTVDGRLL